MASSNEFRIDLQPFIDEAVAKVNYGLEVKAEAEVVKILQDRGYQITMRKQNRGEGAGEELIDSVTQLGEAHQFIVEGIAAVASRARMLDSSIVPLVAIDNLLLEYERKFIK